jgi:putative endonuclease
VAEAWYVYLLRCHDDTLYTGVTTDLARRLRQHNGQLSGGPRYTRGRRPVTLLWSEPVGDRGAAQRREAAVRRLSRRDKLALSAQPGVWST